LFPSRSSLVSAPREPRPLDFYPSLLHIGSWEQLIARRPERSLPLSLFIICPGTKDVHTYTTPGRVSLHSQTAVLLELRLTTQSLRRDRRWPHRYPSQDPRRWSLQRTASGTSLRSDTTELTMQCNATVANSFERDAASTPTAQARSVPCPSLTHLNDPARFHRKILLQRKRG
jgi:hypothetical protein